MAIKEQNIEKIKQILFIENLMPRQEYDINKKMYEEYKKYCADSAIVYVKKNRDIAFSINDQVLIDETAIELSWFYTSTGSYVEASKLLDSIDREHLSESLLPLYYVTYADFCSHYGQSNYNYEYYRKSELYRDSLLLSLDTLSFQFRMESATRQMFSGVNSEGILLELLEEAGDSPYRGSIAWLLGHMYHRKGNIDMCKYYYTISALNDIEYSINDNASLLSLALIYFHQGDIKSAYNIIHRAVEDALFCNARYRLSEASTNYPIIIAKYQDLEKKQMTRLYTLLILISILGIILILSVSFFYRQNKVLSRVRLELSKTNKQLGDLNNKLSSANNSLQESNIIKEEYITHFFDVCSAYIDKLETYRRIITRHAKHERIDEMLKALDFNVIENELNELHY